MGVLRLLVPQHFLIRIVHHGPDLPNLLLLHSLKLLFELLMLDLFGRIDLRAF